MLTCPKCGLSNVQGPLYCKGCGLSGFSPLRHEHMHYRCRHCGYVAFEPCRDVKEPSRGR